MVERHFQEKMPFETRSRKKIPRLVFLKIFKVFFQKNSYFSKKKKANYKRFENFYVFSHFLRQICYNLVERKFHV